jgi:tetratricopeptide (TPR) repeat protein
MRASWDAALENDSIAEPMNTACGICLDEPMEAPVVLSQCHHAFCFACLKDWQNYRYRKLEFNIKPCPLCRGGIEGSVASEASHSAILMMSRARWLAKDDPKREELFDLALTKVEQVLAVDQNETVALGVKAQILTYIRPREAVALLKRTLELDTIVAERREQVIERLKEAYDARDSGDPLTAERLVRELVGHYGTVEGWPAADIGPHRLFSLRIALAEAYEASECWNEAVEEYADIFDHMTTSTSDLSLLSKQALGQIHACAVGLSRCYYHLRRYEDAICKGTEALSMDRTRAGIHRLIAMPQRALARELGIECSGASDPTRTLTTIADAIRTMHRGNVYETPWDEVNKQANREYLLELMAEASDG